MGGATAARCISVFPLLLLPRPSSPRLLRRFSTHFLSPRHLSLSSSFLSPLPKCSSQQLHTHPLKYSYDQPHFPTNDTNLPPHPWPEWLDFLNRVSNSGYFNGSVDDSDEFSGELELTLHFLRAANGCLGFARHHPDLLWSLSREDIKVVVDGDPPFLFKNGSSASRRLKNFLGSGTNEVSASDKPSTVDLMKFLISYAHMAIVFPENMPTYNRVESSVRNLFRELANSRGISSESATSVKKNFPEVHGQAPRTYGKNIEMKKGDWICPRCTYMNFAKNFKCLQCEECRPMKYVTGEEWECPQCSFFNFGKNVVCLKCDCKKPGTSPLQDQNFVSGSTADSSSVKGGMGRRLAGTEKKQPSWLTKITQLEKSSDSSNTVTDEDFSKFKIVRNLGINQNSDSDDIHAPGVDPNIKVQISQYLDEALGEKSSTSNINNNDAQFGATSVDASPLSEAKTNEKPPDQMVHKEREVEKSERWFKKVAELQDVKDLPSAASEESFPEIMPMRKGESRFVVSKKKDRSLTSPTYKRRVAMEQAGNNNYVPFVPFPPGYFAKDKAKEGSELDPTQVSSDNSDTSFNSRGGEDGPTNSIYDAHNNIGQTPEASVSSENGGTDGADCGSSLSQSSENHNVRDIWREKSLEGSAVKDPDPLDMSEEAKAERWFRRVAQIKDISELSQIPDEDFPSIMPLRKGVNRFVVSKRKTPLERRLTSSQYRRNLPDVSSDPVKKENDMS